MRSLIGRKAPAICSTAVVDGNKIVENYSLDQFEGQKYVVLFFYPMDFTFVCPTELHAFQEKLAEFEKRNVQLVACSVDSEFSHYSWLQMPKNKGGIQGVTYPIVSDFSKSISESYGVLAGCYKPDQSGNWVCEGAPVAYRGLFLIDKSGVIRHCVINDLPLGRSVDEVLRTVDALQHFEEFGEVCPANWSQGKDALHATENGVADYLSKH